MMSVLRVSKLERRKWKLKIALRPGETVDVMKYGNMGIWGNWLLKERGQRMEEEDKALSKILYACTSVVSGGTHRHNSSPLSLAYHATAIRVPHYQTTTALPLLLF